MIINDRIQWFKIIVLLIIVSAIPKSAFSQSLMGRTFICPAVHASSTDDLSRSLIFVDDSTCVFNQVWPKAQIEVSLTCQYHLYGDLIELTDMGIQRGDYYESSRLIHWKNKVAADSVALRGFRITKLRRGQRIERIDSKSFNQQARELNKLIRDCFSRGKLVRPAYEKFVTYAKMKDIGVIFHPYHDILMIEGDVISYYVSVPTRLSPFSDEVGGTKREHVSFHECHSSDEPVSSHHHLKNLTDSSIVWNEYVAGVIE